MAAFNYLVIHLNNMLISNVYPLSQSAHKCLYVWWQRGKTKGEWRNKKKFAYLIQIYIPKSLHFCVIFYFVSFCYGFFFLCSLLFPSFFAHPIVGLSLHSISRIPLFLLFDLHTTDLIAKATSNIHLANVYVFFVYLFDAICCRNSWDLFFLSRCMPKSLWTTNNFNRFEIKMRAIHRN